MTRRRASGTKEQQAYHVGAAIRIRVTEPALDEIRFFSDRDAALER